VADSVIYIIRDKLFERFSSEVLRSNGFRIDVVPLAKSHYLNIVGVILIVVMLMSL